MVLSLFDPLRIWGQRIAEDVKGFRREIYRRRGRKILYYALMDPDVLNLLKYNTTAADFEHAHLLDVPSFKSREQLYRWALAHVDDDEGLFLEFGVMHGASINRLARLKPAVTFYGFDSFMGLPESWMGPAKKGAMTRHGALPPVRSNVNLVKGAFEHTLRPFVADRRGAKISFMHVDCDLYSSTRTILTEVRTMLRSGTIIVFDDFFNFARWEEGEYKALMEFAAETGTTFEYIGYIRTGSQVAIRLA